MGPGGGLICGLARGRAIRTWSNRSFRYISRSLRRGGLVSAICRSGQCGGFALIGFQNLRAALVETWPTAKLSQRPIRLQPVLLAVLAEMISDLLGQRRGPLDGRFFKLAADAGGA